MVESTIGQRRLQRQWIEQPINGSAQDVVSYLGAVQAQDYLGALWAVGLRLQQASETMIEQALAARQIVRTWPMRGTLHFVAAADVRWMLALLAPRAMMRSASRLRQLELGPDVLAAARTVLGEALQGGNQLTRPEVYATLEAAQIATAGQRGIHIIGQLAHEGLICFGPRTGAQPSFVLLDEWLPPTAALERPAALAALVQRYFTSHGPATVQDCMWWSGLTAGDVRLGLELAKAELAQFVIDDQSYWCGPEKPSSPMPGAWLLPPFDEFVLGYTERSAIIAPAYKQHLCPGNNGMFSPTIAIDGQLRGTWQRVLKKDTVIITLKPFTPLSADEMAQCAVAAERYAQFLGRAVRLA